MDKKLTITITFRSDEKWLYDGIKQHYSVSGWIKNILKPIVLRQQKKARNAPM